MIQPILIGIALLVSGLSFFSPSGLTPYTYDDGGSGLSFGATNFPTSLDALVNPGATDSVAVVSHSAQHSNANDAIEALQAKLGIGASTAVVNTILVGTGTGSSAYSTFATTTSLVTTNLLVNGSTTLQNFTAQNSTTTNATSTNLFVSGLASTTNLRANTAIFGNSTIGSLSVTSCSGCSSGGAVDVYVATTSNSRYMAKTLNLVAGDLVNFGCFSGSGTNKGTLGFRISSPWSVATTTISDATSVADDPSIIGAWSIVATTTSTYTFECGGGDAGQTRNMWLEVQATNFSKTF